MRQSYHNYSQPILTSIPHPNTYLVKHIPERYENSETTYQGTDEASLLLNALSFRESTVAYADRLYLNPEHKNP